MHRDGDTQGISACDVASLQGWELEHPIERLLVDCAVFNLSNTTHNVE